MTLGQLLQNKRIESGRSLEQVAASTKIHIKILAAIENDHYIDLPARAFTRGFIVNYAKALKMDPEQVLKDHHEFLEQKYSERPARDQGHQGYAFEGKELEQNRRWMVIGASIAVIFAIAVLLLFKPQNHKHREMNKEFEEDTAAASDDGSSPDQTTAVLPDLSASPATSSSPARIIGPLPNSSVAANLPLSTQSSPPAVAFSATPQAILSPSPKPSPTPSPAPSATPKATPSSTPNGKEDKLNKGDDLTQVEAKRKITFEAKEDVWVRYRSDDRPMNSLILRKGRFLVIKAKSKLLFEVNHPEFVSYKAKKSYGALSFGKGELTDTGAQAYDGAELGTIPLPEEAPSRPSGQ